jgi:hypothetical protein
MSKSLAVALLACTLFAGNAHAQKAYVGASVAGSTLHYHAPGVPEIDDRIVAGKLYAGYAFNDVIALEGGWSVNQTGRFAKSETGAPHDASFKANVAYAAARATYRISEAWSVAGKLGAARHSLELTRGATTERHHDVRAMFGVGTSYDLTPNAALTLDLNHYGTVRTKNTEYRVIKLEAGVRFSF